jgi:hypothetical protein
MNELIEQVKKLRELLGPDGEYSIGRKDGEDLGLGDQLIIGQIFEDIAKDGNDVYSLHEKANQAFEPIGRP